MDRQVKEEMQFLGFLGIIKESIKIICTWRKIFSQMSLAFILPLCFIAHMEVASILFVEIGYNERMLDGTDAGNPKYDKLSNLERTNMIKLWLFGAVCFIASFVFSLLSTAAVTYTIACIYTAKSITFNKVMGVVPKVWKRLMITFLCSFLTIFAFILVFAMSFFLVFITIKSKAIGLTLASILLVLYLAGGQYITAIGSLASVVSVLEESHGFQAMIKSKNLIKGKTGVSIAIFTLISLACMVVQVALYIVVADGWGLGFLTRLGLAVICFLVLFKLILFNFVVQTVIYFVCKSYHRESIDKLVIADDLEVYLLSEKVDV